LNFRELHKRLIDVARERVHAGEFTERGLARIAGVSQPHMHNVLKGIRDLSADSADRLMAALGLNIPDPVWPASIQDEPLVRRAAVPLLRNRIGPGISADFSVFRGYKEYEETALQGLVDPVAARLAPDPALPRELAANDLVLLDQSPRVRESPDRRSCWVVAVGSGLRVRYLRTSKATSGRTKAVRLEAGAAIGVDAVWQPIVLRGRNILDIVRARIVQLEREMEREPTGPADSPRQGD
jgi:hypothetical protein